MWFWVSSGVGNICFAVRFSAIIPQQLSDGQSGLGVVGYGNLIWPYGQNVKLVRYHRRIEIKRSRIVSVRFAASF